TTLSALGQAELEAMFSASVVQTGADGVDGAVNWTFDAPAGAFDFMREGEVLRIAYAITLSDGKGGSTTRVVSVEVAGTNDLPRIDAADDGFVDEEGLTDDEGTVIGNAGDDAQDGSDHATVD